MVARGNYRVKGSSRKKNGVKSASRNGERRDEEKKKHTHTQVERETIARDVSAFGHEDRQTDGEQKNKRQGNK